MPRETPKIVNVLVTRDVTQSAHLTIEVGDDESVLQAAKRQVREIDWTFDEGNQHDIYFGDEGNDVQPATPADLELREEFVANLEDQEREQAMLAAAREILSKEETFATLESHGLAVAGTEITRKIILEKLESALVDALRTTEVYRSGRAPAP